MFLWMRLTSSSHLCAHWLQAENRILCWNLAVQRFAWVHPWLWHCLSITAKTTPDCFASHPHKLKFFLKPFLPTVHEDNLNSLWAHEDESSCNNFLNVTAKPDSSRALFVTVFYYFFYCYWFCLHQGQCDWPRTDSIGNIRNPSHNYTQHS